MGDLVVVIEDDEVALKGAFGEPSKRDVVGLVIESDENKAARSAFAGLAGCFWT